MPKDLGYKRDEAAMFREGLAALFSLTYRGKEVHFSMLK